jgi:hypothetical protein
VCSRVIQYFAEYILNFVDEHNVGDNVSMSLKIIIIMKN